ncbi:unnamed protein product [Calypogeia fissa]
MADMIMVDGECTALPPLPPDAAGAPMQIHTFADVDSGSVHFQGPLALQTSLPSAPAGSSPGKYIPPRLRRSASPASSPTGLSKRPLDVIASPNWRDNQIFRQSAVAANLVVSSTSPPSQPPPPPTHKVLVANWGLTSFFAPRAFLVHSAVSSG